MSGEHRLSEGETWHRRKAAERKGFMAVGPRPSRGIIRRRTVTASPGAPSCYGYPVSLSAAKGLGRWGHLHSGEPLPRFFVASLLRMTVLRELPCEVQEEAQRMSLLDAAAATGVWMVSLPDARGRDYPRGTRCQSPS